jgi:pimeloyl-ACP methyl ester carboxylesterase
MIKNAGTKAGVPVIPSRLSILTQKINDERGQCFFCSQCNRGCQVHADFSSSSVLVKPAIATGNVEPIAGFRDVTAATPNLLSANVSIQCYDRPVAGTAATSMAWAKAWGKFSPTFGPSLAWSAQPCFTWPVRQGQPRVDVTPVTKAPVLLIGGTHDPNTPLWMAKKTAPLFAGGRLLVWDGYGHVSANRSIPCVNNAAAAYLVNGTLPATGTVCPAVAAPV